MAATAKQILDMLDSVGVYPKAPHSRIRWTVYHDPRITGVAPTVLGHVTKLRRGYVATTADDLMAAVDLGVTRITLPEVACRLRRAHAIWDLTVHVRPDLIEQLADIGIGAP